MPIEIRTARAAPSPAAPGARARSPGRPRGGKRISGQERMFFTERISLLLETGVPLHEGLRTLAAQAGSAEMRGVLESLREGIEAGLSFSHVLERHPEMFPTTYVNLVGAGEKGGFLQRALDRLKELDEKREELRSTLVSAFTYPGFLIAFSVAVVFFVLVVVFPKFSDIFEMIRDQLPATTRFLMGLSEVLRRQWAPLLGGGAAVGALAWHWSRQRRGAEALDRLALRLPLLRDIVIQYQLVQFLHVMSLSLSNGVPLLEALRSCREVVSSATFRGFLDGLQTRVSEGRGLASGFQDSGFLPALVPQMLATGEESGSLALVMGRVAEFYERDWRRKLDLVAKIVEPALLLIMGVVVGLIVSSLLLPIFKLSKAVH